VRVLAAASLDPGAAAVVRASAARHELEVVEVDAEAGAAPLLRAFDAALCASGTACLEAAMAGAPPVIAYRVDWLTYRAARWLLRTPHVGLPNVLLGRRAFPELLQDDAIESRVVAAAEDLLADGRANALAAAEELRGLFTAAAPVPGKAFGERVAALLEPWL
jgi:lipid-A-disaccharide synthase